MHFLGSNPVDVRGLKVAALVLSGFEESPLGTNGGLLKAEHLLELVVVHVAGEIVGEPDNVTIEFVDVVETFDYDVVLLPVSHALVVLVNTRIALAISGRVVCEVVDSIL